MYTGSSKNIVVNLCKTLGILAATILVTELLRYTPVENAILLILYLFSVFLISCITPNYSYGLIACLLSTLAYDYFITEPRFAFSFSYTIGSPITLVTMFAVTILTSTLTLKLQHQASFAKQEQAFAQRLSEINQKLLVTRKVERIAQFSCDYLLQDLGCAAIIYTNDPHISTDGMTMALPAKQDASIFQTKEEYQRIHRIFKHGAEELLRPSSEDLHAVTYFPLVANQRVLGVMGVALPEDALTEHHWRLIRALIGQVTVALDLQYGADQQYDVLIQAAKEKMRCGVLGAISQDLRAPIQTILDDSFALQKQLSGDVQSDAGQRAGHIAQEAKWLLDMIENLFTISQLCGEQQTIQKTVQDIQVVAKEAVKSVESRFPDDHIHIHLPEKPMMVAMDAALITQVMVYFLENAVQNASPETLIMLDIEQEDQHVRIDISDNGRDIPSNLLQNLMEDTASSMHWEMESAHSIGIIVAMCKAIIHAHGGQIHGYNRKSGGTHFSFVLPLSAAE